MTAPSGGPDPGAEAAPAAAPVAACVDAYDSGARPERSVEKAAVKAVLAALAAAAPGRSVEVRVPPYAVIQAVAGPVHRRGTPPATVETDARTLIELATGALSWADAVAAGRVRASGERCDLSPWLPLPPGRE